jgi:flavin reductase (DIM6/NTAB) family NADH-FMN oxidoreductase RutF
MTTDVIIPISRGRDGVAVDERAFREAMASFASGVTVVTTKSGEEQRGMTANALTSLSLRPPLVLVSIDRQARTHELLLASGIFAISVLKEEQQWLAQIMAREDEEEKRRLQGIAYEVAVTGAPVIPGALAFLDCRVVGAYPGGDHTIFVGEVVASGASEGRPLLYYRRGYRKLQLESDRVTGKGS